MGESLGVDGIVHLSVESGCGGTTFALQVAREHLANGKHVAWVCAEMPDSGRFSQLYSDVDIVAVSRLHVITVGENIAQGITSAKGMLSALASISLIVIDDWAPKSGKVPSETLENMRGLLNIIEDKSVSILLVSSAYEDASGATRWKSRGDIDCSVWFLHRVDSMLSVRELHKDGLVIQYNLVDEGFILRN